MSDAFISGKAKLFDEGNFGMFIHWGLFSNLGGVWEGKTYYGIGEWLMNKRVADIPPKDYMAAAKILIQQSLMLKQLQNWQKMLV